MRLFTHILPTPMIVLYLAKHSRLFNQELPVYQDRSTTTTGIGHHATTTLKMSHPVSYNCGETAPNRG